MDDDVTGVIFGMGVLILGTVLVAVALMVWSSFAKAKVARRDQEALDRLVARYEDLAARFSDHQSATSADLADVRRSVMEVERMMREVG